MLRVYLCTLDLAAGAAVAKRVVETLMAQKIWAVDNTDYRHDPERMQARGVAIAVYVSPDHIPGAAPIITLMMDEHPALEAAKDAVRQAIKSTGVHSHVNG